jgi:hypothetical protein
MKLTIDFNSAQFRAAAQDAVRKLNANSEQLIKEEGRLFLPEWRKRIPPFANGYGKSESAHKDKAAGEKAVRGDLRRVAAPLDPATIKIPRLKELVEANDEAGIQAFFNAVKDATWRARHVIKQASLRSVHEPARNNRGRIRKDLWNAVIDGAARASYVQEVISRVGSAKATFNRAAAALGARIPAYIARHGMLGGYSEGKGPNFFIVISGQSNVPNAQRAADEAIAIRGKKLASEIKRLVSAFARTGKIPSRRKSLNP